MHLIFGAPVTTTDDQEAGRVRRLVIDPSTGTVPYFILDYGLLSPDVIVPLVDIAAVEDDGTIRLTLDADRVAALPRDIEEEFIVAESPSAAPTDLVMPATGGLLPLGAHHLGGTATPAGTPFNSGADAFFGMQPPESGVMVVRSSVPEWMYRVDHATVARTSDGWEIGHIVGAEVAHGGHLEALLARARFRRATHRVPFDAVTEAGPERVIVGESAERFLQEEAEMALEGEADAPA